MAARLSFSLTQLEYVTALHRLGHFAKAAAACHVTQPTLSMQVRKVEEALGVVLFDRTKKPIRLTAAGARVIEQLQAVLNEARKIPSLLEVARAGRVQGELTVGVIPTVAPYLLPRLLPVLEADHPGLTLKLLELQTHRIVEALEHDELDAGLLAIPLGESKIHERSLYFEPFSVLCQKRHPLARLKKVAYAKLSADDIWLLQEGHCLRDQVLDVCTRKKHVGHGRAFEFESGSLETLKNLVDSYGGYTLLPTLATSAIGPASKLVPFERPIPAREVGLVFRREHYKRELIDALGDAAVKSVPPALRKLRRVDLEVIPVEQ
jgi:LysR family hydrogen peroxide-inducible transcriptional activator